MKPYVKNNKNDAADAEAICEAVGRPNMRFVPIKTVEQQAVLSVHRVSQRFVKARTAQANQIRGLLAEFGTGAPRVRTSHRAPTSQSHQRQRQCRYKVRMYGCNPLQAIMN